MEESTNYIDRLEEALKRQQGFLDAVKLPQLKSSIINFHQTFQHLLKVLKRKLLFEEDPYHDDRKISDVTIPPTDPIPENGRSDEISRRLAELDIQLEFLLNYYQFSTEYLVLGRIKLTLGLLQYVHWNSVTENSTHINTRGLGLMLAKIRGGPDTFTTKVINDALRQLSAYVQDAIITLKDLTRYHREHYKYELRRNVFEPMVLDVQKVAHDRQGVIDAVKGHFAKKLSGVPYFPELVEEVLAEDYEPGGDEKREAVLEVLHIEERKEEEPNVVSYKPILMASVRLLAGASRHIESALRKLDADAAMIEGWRLKRYGFLRRFLYRLIRSKKEDRIYEVEMVDPTTGVGKKNRVNFDAIQEKGLRLAKVLASYSSQLNPAYARLESLSEDEIYKIVDSSLMEVSRFAQVLKPLFSYLQSGADRDQRNRLRGIRIELNGINNAYLKANQRRHEFAARKEEEEQLKRLGIAPQQ